MTNAKQLNSQSLSDLADLYNSMVAPEKRIKKFSDKQSAVKRITTMLAGESKEKLAKPPTDADKKKTLEKVLQSNNTRSLKPSEVKTSNGGIVNLNLKVSSTIGIKEKIMEKKKEFKIVGKKSQHAGKTIHILAEKNPRQAGSGGWHNFNIYKEGMTYEDFIMKKGGNNHLLWDLKKGFVELK